MAGSMAIVPENPDSVLAGPVARLILMLAAFVSFGSAASAQAPLPFALEQVGPAVYGAIDGILRFKEPSSIVRALLRRSG